MLWGGSGAGKSTLLRALQGGPAAHKTQMVEYAGDAIDTPGEYAEIVRLSQYLLTTANDADVIVVVQDATRGHSNFVPNYFCAFNKPVIGVVTKMDAPGANANRAESILRTIGVSGEIFFVSALTGTGLSELRQSLNERRSKWQVTVDKVERRSA